MALVSSKGVVEKAYKEGYAVPAFNTQGGDYDMCRAIVETAEEEKAPVILMAYEANLAYRGYDGFSAVVSHLANRVSVPVSMHLDHAMEIENIKDAVKYGFTSVMIDYSKRSIDENIEVTKEALSIIGEKDIAVETEIGELQRLTENPDTEPKNLVNPKDVKKYLESCCPDMLAIGIGNAHGFYKGKPNIRIDLLKQIADLGFDVPLVLHGSTGIPEETVKECVKNGISKVNFGTSVRWNYYEYVKTIFDTELGKQGHMWKIDREAMTKLKEDIRTIIRLCEANGKA